MREQNTFCVCAGFWHDSNSIGVTVHRSARFAPCYSDPAVPGNAAVQQLYALLTNLSQNIYCCVPKQPLAMEEDVAPRALATE
jgi:hypothetical protein